MTGKNKKTSKLNKKKSPSSLPEKNSVSDSEIAKSTYRANSSPPETTYKEKPIKFTTQHNENTGPEATIASSSKDNTINSQVYLENTERQVIDGDIAMDNNNIPLSESQLPSNDFENNENTQVPNVQDKSRDPINKGKSIDNPSDLKKNITTKDAPGSDDEFKGYNGAEFFSLFIPVPSHLNETDARLKNIIFDKFTRSTELQDVKGPIVNNTLKYFVVHFTDENSRNRYQNETIIHKKITLRCQIYNNDTITQAIIDSQKDYASRTVKLLDVPLDISVELLKKRMEAIGEVIKIQKLDRPPQQNHSYRQNNPYSTPRPTQRYSKQKFLQFHVTFKDRSTLTRIFEKEDIWVISVNSHFIRIVPWFSKAGAFLERTSFCYHITGLPINTNIIDLKPIVKKLSGKTCTIVRGTKGISTAYVYVKEQDYMDQIKSFNVFGTKIYVIPNGVSTQTCNACGSPTHNIFDCARAFKDNRGIMRANNIYIKRDNSISI